MSGLTDGERERDAPLTPVGQAEAIDLLTRVSAASPTGLIQVARFFGTGGPPWTIATSVGAVRRAAAVERGQWEGRPALFVTDSHSAALVWIFFLDAQA